MFFSSLFGCWLLPEKFSFCPKNDGFARVWGGAAAPSPLARAPMYMHVQQQQHSLYSF